MVHLDMPSVVRVAEQRVGRVDRMYSPHKRIEAYWPEDSEEFALRSDERFIERYETVESLIGSNMPHPPELGPYSGSAIRAADLAREHEESGADADRDGVQDAFAPVRELVKGDTAVVSEATYRHYRHVSAHVVSRVSLVKTEQPWAFFCVRGTRFGAPNWVLISGRHSEPVTELKEIVDEFRRRLTPTTENLEFDDRSARELDRMHVLHLIERALLPSLRDIRGDLLGDRKLELDAVFAAFEGVDAPPPIDERVVSCIIGVG